MKAQMAGLLMLLVTSAWTEDLQKYLSDTQDMVKQGNYEEALKRYVWFHEHALEHEPGMYGVRLSFALGYWKSLGDVFPPAKAALIETRDRKEKSLNEGTGDSQLFHDVASLNQTLGEDSRTVKLFEQLHEKQPDLAKACWSMAKDAVVAAKRYDLAGKYFGDPVLEFAKIKEMYDHNVSLYENPRIGGANFRQYNEQSLVQRSLMVIEVALALGDTKGAAQVQQQALAVIDNAGLRNAIPGQNGK